MFLPISSAVSRLKDGLFLAVPFDDTACRDVSPARVTANILGSGLSSMDGPFGPAVYFAGTDQRIYYAMADGEHRLNSGFTFSGWAYRETASRYCTLFWKGASGSAAENGTAGNTQIELHANTTTGEPVTVVSDGSTRTVTFGSTVSFPANEWFHVVYSSRSNQQIVWWRSASASNVEYFSTSISGVLNNIATDTRIGGRRSDATYCWKGAFSMFGFWNRAFSQAEMEACRYWRLF